MNKFICSSCKFPITKVRFSSLEHTDKNLCNKCVNKDTNNLYVRVTDEIKASSCPLLQKRNSLIHSGIGCNICNTMNIIGIRYVCVTCCINICEQCEFKGKHDLTHNRLKIYHPSAHKLAANTDVLLKENKPTESLFNTNCDNFFDYKRDGIFEKPIRNLFNGSNRELFPSKPTESLFNTNYDNFLNPSPTESLFDTKCDGLFNNIKWKFDDNKM